MARRKQAKRGLDTVYLPVQNTVTYSQGEVACIDTTENGTVRPMAAANANLIAIGYFIRGGETGAASTGDGTTPVGVQLFEGRMFHWMDNAAGGDAVTSDDIGSVVYANGPSEVTITSTGRSAVGRAMAVDSTKGVLVAFSAV